MLFLCASKQGFLAKGTYLLKRSNKEGFHDGLYPAFPKMANGLRLRHITQADAYCHNGSQKAVAHKCDL